jgi:hypothetical protein
MVLPPNQLGCGARHPSGPHEPGPSAPSWGAFLGATHTSAGCGLPLLRGPSSRAAPGPLAPEPHPRPAHPRTPAPAFAGSDPSRGARLRWTPLARWPPAAPSPAGLLPARARSGPEALRSVDVEDANVLRAEGDGVAIDDHRPTAIEGLGRRCTCREEREKKPGPEHGRSRAGP